MALYRADSSVYFRYQPYPIIYYMSSGNFSVQDIRSAVLFGWRHVKDHLRYFLGLAVVVILVSAVPNAIVNRLGDTSSSLVGFLVILALWVVQIGVNIGLIHLALLVVDGVFPSFGELVAHFDLLPRYLAATILYTLLVMAGLVLFVVPGVVWAVKYGLYSYYVVDRRAGAIESLRLSGQATKGAKTPLVLLILVLAGVNLLGVLALGVGLLISMPITLLAFAWTYRKLSSPPTVGSTDA